MMIYCSSFFIELLFFYFIIYHALSFFCLMFTCRRDPTNSRLPRSSSIDSMVEAVWNESTRPSIIEPDDVSSTSSTHSEFQFTSLGSISGGNGSGGGGGGSGSSSKATLSLLGPTIRRESLLSPSAGRRTKQFRGINGKCSKYIKLIICFSFLNFILSASLYITTTMVVFIHLFKHL